MDLADVVRAHAEQILEGDRLRSNLAYALNGATKVLTTLLDGEWDVGWPMMLVDRGRAALAGVVERLEAAEEAWRFSAEYLEALKEAWLADADPERTPEAEREAERRRRAEVTEENRMPTDLVVPPRYRTAHLDGLLVDEIPGHRECAEFAKAPDGILVLHGELRSGLFEIQWAIAHWWFIEGLHPVRAVEWDDLVESNVFAQQRGLWDSPRLVVSRLCPVHVGDETFADPGCAERMLEYRLLRRLPTLVTVERYALVNLNLRHRTVQLLEETRNIVLSRLTNEQRGSSEMFR